MRLPFLTRRRVGLLLLILPVLLLAGVVGKVFVEDDNFRMSSPTLFRSGQLRAEEWQESFDQSHYRSVLNLRGAKPNASWYQNEVKFAADNGLSHYDFALSASVRPSLEQMQQIITIMRDAPKPLLIHCKNGSDRSGLAAALYLRAIQGLPADQASRQLSLWYGHFPWFGSKSGAMDSALDEYLTAQARADAKASVAGLD